MAFDGIKRSARLPLKDRRILVVADDWFIADAMAGLLETQGADVFGPAATVAEGAQLAKYWPIEIAVLDLNLNGQRADDLVVELARKDVPVVVVTGDDIKQPVIDNAFATLKKPVTSAELLNTLYQAANSAHRGASATAPPVADKRLPRTR
jgi:DNA-binding response OmpR family regulator